MMEAAQEADDEVFLYMGGNQQVPDGVRRARIHISVKIVRANAFRDRRRLISVEFHDDVEIIEEWAFCDCCSLKSIKLLGIRIIKEGAFNYCTGLTDVEFGDKLETIEHCAFFFCKAMTKIRMPSVRTVGRLVFSNCYEISYVECGQALRALEEYAFQCCFKLKRISLPLKDSIFENDVFDCCPKLDAVDLVGEIHQTVACLHMGSWRSEINIEINRINSLLPTITAEKTPAIQQWMESVIDRLDNYKAEHHQMLMEATTLLELALWKANLDDHEYGEREGVRTTRGSRKRARKEICVTSGASIVIKNVLPFLALK